MVKVWHFKELYDYLSKSKYDTGPDPPLQQSVNENIPGTCNMNNMRFSRNAVNFLPNKNRTNSSGLSVNPYTKYKPLPYFRIFSEDPYK